MPAAQSKIASDYVCINFAARFFGRYYALLLFAAYNGRMADTPPAIRRLSDLVIDQIAAGEVIERPVSVVKELVENSLDAGASRIDIETVNGGIDRIVISDNGHGISADNIAAACTRHWTSKLTQLDDLQVISSLGFRGEALASIAAVADMTVTTRTATDDHAWQVAVGAGGEIPQPRPAQGARGTRIEVSRLFHRIPARKRFLKQARTEYLHILRLTRQLAFANPHTEFSLSQEGSRGLRLAPAEISAAPAGLTHSARWRTVFGKQFCDKAVAVQFDDGATRIAGWVAPGEDASSQTDTQFIAVNGRVVRDKQLQHAIRMAYGDSVPPGRFPGYAVSIEMAGDTVDVNVHPGKLEIRLSDMRGVHDALFSCVQHALHTQPSATYQRPGLHHDSTAGREPEVTRSIREASYPSTYSRAGSSSANAASTQQEPTRFAGVIRLFGQVLLFEHDKKLAAIDLTGAWCAVLQRRLQTAIDDDSLTARPLLLPVRLAHDHPLAAEACRDAAAAMALEVDDLGHAGTMLRSIPALAPECNGDIVAEVLQQQLVDRDLSAAVVATAIASAVDVGQDGRVRRACLADLERAAASAEFDLSSCIRSVDEAMLATWLLRDQ